MINKRKWLSTGVTWKNPNKGINKLLMHDFSLRHSDLIGLGLDLTAEIFRRSPGVSTIQ